MIRIHTFITDNCPTWIKGTCMVRKISRKLRIQLTMSIKQSPEEIISIHLLLTELCRLANYLMRKIILILVIIGPAKETSKHQIVIIILPINLHMFWKLKTASH